MQAVRVIRSTQCGAVLRTPSRQRRRHSQPAAAAAAPRHSPQNVDNPITMPSPELSAEETVAVQLDALQQNDTPWPNHGMQTMYAFGEGFGGLEASWYFGYPKDTYHEDHTVGQLGNVFPQLISAESWSITAVDALDERRTMVEVLVVPRGGGDACSLTFALRKKTAGSRQGSWLTKMLLHGDMEQAKAHIDSLMRR